MAARQPTLLPVAIGALALAAVVVLFQSILEPAGDHGCNTTLVPSTFATALAPAHLAAAARVSAAATGSGPARGGSLQGRSLSRYRRAAGERECSPAALPGECSACDDSLASWPSCRRGPARSRRRGPGTARPATFPCKFGLEGKWGRLQDEAPCRRRRPGFASGRCRGAAPRSLGRARHTSLGRGSVRRVLGQADVVVEPRQTRRARRRHWSRRPAARGICCRWMAAYAVIRGPASSTRR